MKHPNFNIFAALLGAVLLSACGGGGGGGSPMMDMQPLVSDVRPLTADEMQELASKTVIRYRPDFYTTAEFTSTSGIEAAILSVVQTDFSLRLSPNPDSNLCNPDNCDYHVEVLNRQPGYTRVYELRLNGAFIGAGTVVVINQDGTNYLAAICEDTPSETDYCSISDGSGGYTLAIDTFNLPPMEYSITGDAVFRFNRGLIENAHAFGNFHINAENKHVEYRWTPYSDLFIDGGFRRFGNADVSYAKLQTDYNNFYFQYTLGNVQSNYYKSGKIDGMAFGWQKNGFAVKAEKPIGNGDKSWLRMFYKRELK